MTLKTKLFYAEVTAMDAIVAELGNMKRSKIDLMPKGIKSFNDRVDAAQASIQNEKSKSL